MKDNTPSRASDSRTGPARERERQINITSAALSSVTSRMQCCLSDLRCMIIETPRHDIHMAVAGLHHDGLAQVLSFAPLPQGSHTFRTVSPCARLYVEALNGRLTLANAGHGEEETDVDVQLTYGVTVDGTHSTDAERLSLWFMECCGLHMNVVLNTNTKNLLEFLPCLAPAPVYRVSIFIDVFENPPLDAAEVARVMDAVASSQPHMAILECFDHLTDAAALTTSPHLRHVQLGCWSHLSTLASWSQCPQLRSLECWECYEVRDVRGLAGAPQLRKLSLTNCGLLTLEGLNTCPLLRELDISSNPDLGTLEGLAGTPQLQILRANDCSLTNLEGVTACLMLTQLDISQNVYLESVAGVAHLPHLQLLSAVNCGLESLERLNECPVLAELDVSDNETLHSLRDLAGAPQLRRVQAWNCGLQGVEGLNRCPQLRELDVSYNEGLTDLSGLAEVPNLSVTKS